jgi:uncharacterized protein (TIGR02996 family)
MTEGDALYRAILAAPDDDAPRLVWADWLEENGDPDRAEFVRLQCEWAALDPGDPRRAELGERSGDLLLRSRSRWLTGLGIYGQPAGFWRGLPDWFGVMTDVCIEHITDLRRRIPAQCIKLRLAGFREELRHWPGLDAIRCLWLCESMPDPYYPHSSIRGWVWLIQSPRLCGLQALRAVTDFSSAGVISAISGTDWPHLRELTLTVHGCDPARPPAAWEDLSDATWFRGLRSLDLRDCALTDDTILRLLTGRGPLALTYLDLRGNYVTPRGIRRLYSSGAVTQLRCLRTSPKPMRHDGPRGEASGVNPSRQ